MLKAARSLLSFQTLTTCTLLACALVTTALVVRRELLDSGAPDAPASRIQQPVQQTPLFYENWREALSAGIRMGPADAPVQLIEFADFQCPYCARAHDTLTAVQQKYGDKLAVTFAHYPLATHKFAEEAARAAECAAAQGRFASMQAVLYKNQASLGAISWSKLGAEAALPSIPLFATCLDSTAVRDRVVQSKSRGDALGVQATPTIFINGWKLARPPSASELERMIDVLLSGQNPFPSQAESVSIAAATK